MSGSCSKADPSRLLQLPKALLLLIFRFFSAEELPRIAAAAPRLWRLLLRGELLQRGSSTRLHSGRRWLDEGPTAELADGSNVCCLSVVPSLMAMQPGRVSRLSLSSRVLEPSPPVSLLLVLRAQSSSLQQLLISSTDFCSQGVGASGDGPSIGRTERSPVRGHLLDAVALPCCAQQREGVANSSSEAEEGGATGAPLPTTAVCVLAGVAFPHLERLMVQGCQAFLWLRLLSCCSFPNCKELTVACACIRQHTLPPPHGAAAAAADLLSVVRAMNRLQLLHLELALPPTRYFWRAVLFPLELQHSQQQKRLRVSEGVFLNLAEVLEEAKLLGFPAVVGRTPKQPCTISEISVVAAHRRLHSAAMLRSLAAAGCTDTSIPGYAVQCEFVEVQATPRTASSRTLLQLLRHANHLRLVLGSSEEAITQQRSPNAAPLQSTRVADAAAAARAGLETAGDHVQVSPGAQRLPFEARQEHQETALAAVAAQPDEAAAIAAQLCRMAEASRSIALDIRDGSPSLLALQQAARLRGQQLCHWKVPRSGEAVQRRGQEQPVVAAPAAGRGDTAAPSVRVVGLPSCVRGCVLPLEARWEDPRSKRASVRFHSCSCSNRKCRRATETTGTSGGSGNRNRGTRVCVCSVLQLRVLPLLRLFPYFLLGHSAGGLNPWGADTTTALLQSDLLLLQQVCSSALLRPRCIGLEVQAAGQTPHQRRSFSRFLGAAVALPEGLRPPLQMLRVSLVSEPEGVCCISGDVKLSNRVLNSLLGVLQQYPMLQRVEITAPLYLRDPLEEPSAAKEPLSLLQFEQMLQQQGFVRGSCISSSSFRHVFVFKKAATSRTC